MRPFQDLVTDQGTRVVLLLISAFITAALVRLAVRLVNWFVQIPTPRPDLRRAYVVGLISAIVLWGFHAAFVAAGGDRMIKLPAGGMIGTGTLAARPVSFFLIAGLLI